MALAANSSLAIAVGIKPFDVPYSTVWLVAIFRAEHHLSFAHRSLCLRLLLAIKGGALVC